MLLALFIDSDVDATSTPPEVNYQLFATLSVAVLRIVKLLRHSVLVLTLH